MVDEIPAQLLKIAGVEARRIERLVRNEHEMRHVFNEQPEYFRRISLHEWDDRLAGRRLEQYEPVNGGRYTCPRCYIEAGERVNFEPTAQHATAGQVLSCPSCKYEFLPAGARDPAEAESS